jgi:hypothetical protein
MMDGPYSGVALTTAQNAARNREAPELAPYLASATRRRGFNSIRQFGVGLARATRDPEALRRQAYRALELHESNQRDPSIFDGVLQRSPHSLIITSLAKASHAMRAEHPSRRLGSI